MPKVSYKAEPEIEHDGYFLTDKDIQQIIEYFTEKKIRLDKIKGYMNVKRSKIAHQK